MAFHPCPEPLGPAALQLPARLASPTPFPQNLLSLPSTLGCPCLLTTESGGPLPPKPPRTPHQVPWLYPPICPDDFLTSTCLVHRHLLLLPLCPCGVHPSRAALVTFERCHCPTSNLQGTLHLTQNKTQISTLPGNPRASSCLFLFSHHTSHHSYPNSTPSYSLSLYMVSSSPPSSLPSLLPSFLSSSLCFSITSSDKSVREDLPGKPTPTLCLLILCFSSYLNCH